MIDAVRANDEGRCCTDVVPLTPITNREFARASQSQTVVVSESQSLNVVSWRTRRYTWAARCRRNTLDRARAPFGVEPLQIKREGSFLTGRESDPQGKLFDWVNSPIPEPAGALLSRST